MNYVREIDIDINGINTVLKGISRITSSESFKQRQQTIGDRMKSGNLFTVLFCFTALVISTSDGFSGPVPGKRGVFKKVSKT